MAKSNLSTIFKIVDVISYIKLLRNSIMLYKKSNNREDIVEALEYSRKIYKLTLKIYLEHRFK